MRRFYNSILSKILKVIARVNLYRIKGDLNSIELYNDRLSALLFNIQAKLAIDSIDSDNSNTFFKKKMMSIA